MNEQAQRSGTKCQDAFHVWLWVWRPRGRSCQGPSPQVGWIPSREVPGGAPPPLPLPSPPAGTVLCQQHRSHWLLHAGLRRDLRVPPRPRSLRERGASSVTKARRCSCEALVPQKRPPARYGVLSGPGSGRFLSPVLPTTTRNLGEHRTGEGQANQALEKTSSHFKFTRLGRETLKQPLKRHVTSQKLPQDPDPGPPDAQAGTGPRPGFGAPARLSPPRACRRGDQGRGWRWKHTLTLLAKAS